VVAVGGLVAGAVLVVVLAANGVSQPSAVRSVQVIENDARVRAEPSANARLRGRLKGGQRLGFIRRVQGPGCGGGGWIQLAEDAYVCEGDVTVSSLAPSARRQPDMTGGDPNGILPYRYVFIKRDGTRAFHHPADSGARAAAKVYRRGFSFPVVSRLDYLGETFLQTWAGLYVRESQVNDATPSTFQGARVSSAAQLGSVGWTIAEAAVHQEPGQQSPELRRIPKHTQLRISGVSDDWLALADGGFVPTRLVRQPQPTQPPPEVGSRSPWIDIDLSRQVITFYRGDMPVMASLTSTGTEETDRHTPTGTFRIRHKLALGTMDRTDFPDPEEDYSLEGIPWVQYFQGSNALHAAFWHQEFGRRRSHGCVNLAPRDAQFAFDFTSPELPVGWSEVRSSEADPGTIVRVRR
jgi:hypothetical protein